ncbi:hypothetical protein DFJ77DRAFT_239603 [Powellomyces hirtus]|nr:hypothetical protein DFJ77DRAFT_239603 [Powellomyces hirtus]
MPTTQRVSFPQEFEPALERALAETSGRVFVYLFASEDPKTGKSWCPDCVTSDPLVAAEIQKVPSATLLVVPVGDRPTWRDPSNFYRTHPRIAATAVPTLIEWGTGGPVKRLVESEVNNVDGLRKFFQW